jgi:hypothetical protein
MPNNTKYSVGYSTNRTTNVRPPKKFDGSTDMRYSRSQFCKSDGTRDLRTNILK